VGECYEQTRDITHTYRGYMTIIKGVGGMHCEHCKDVVLAFTDSERVSQEMLVFNRKVDIEHPITTDDELRIAVKKTNLVLDRGEQPAPDSPEGQHLQALLRHIARYERQRYLNAIDPEPPCSSTRWTAS
jgi:hypothetical protein